MITDNRDATTTTRTTATTERTEDIKTTAITTIETHKTEDSTKTTIAIETQKSASLGIVRLEKAQKGGGRGGCSGEQYQQQTYQDGIEAAA